MAIPPPAPPPTQPPSSGAEAFNPQFEPQPVVVPVVTPLSSITTTTDNFHIEASRVVDKSLSHITLPNAQGTALPSNAAGVNGSSGIGGEMTPYGASGQAGLVGGFYDLKQTPSGEPTDIAQNDWEKANSPDNYDPNWANESNTKRQLETLRDFVTSWGESDLEKYYKAPNSLSLNQICIHEGPSSLATKAFKVADKVVARRWIAIYTAKVLPPESGTYRFIGCADDFLVVNVDNRNVLDACNTGQILDSAARTNENVGSAWQGFSLYAGPWFDVEQGTPINIKILIGEGPGGSSGFVLMIQQKGDNSAKGDYPIFQVQDVAVPDMDIPNFSKKKMLFQLAPQPGTSVKIWPRYSMLPRKCQTALLTTASSTVHYFNSGLNCLIVLASAHSLESSSSHALKLAASPYNFSLLKECNSNSGKPVLGLHVR